MIIVMEHNATQEQLDRVTKYIEDRGMKTYIHRGDMLNVIGVLGNEITLNPENIAVLDGVSAVKKVQEPYKLVSRISHPEDTVIKFPNGVKIGGLEKPVLMVGPCSVEKDFDGLLQVAMAAKERELTEELSRSNRRPTDIKVKRIAALVTDGDRPATNANVQSDTTTRLSFKRERRTS